MTSINGEVCEVSLGLPGQGKTLSQTENIVIPSLLDGIDVYVNYWINCNLENYHYFRDFEEIKDVRNCIVVFDELCHVLDPRHWDAEGSAVRDFFQLHRHRHVDIIGNTQHVSLIAKTALIEVSRFVMCEKIFNGSFINLFFPKFPWLVIKELEMTLKEIKLEDSNYVLTGDEAEEFETGKFHIDWFRKKKLLHNELDYMKTELIHWYCPKCMQRQGYTVGKDETFLIAEKIKDKYYLLPEIVRPSCPKHKNTLLDIRASAMYDTDYEIEVPNKEVVFMPFAKTQKLAPYRGRLSPEQTELKKQLESSF